MPAANSEINNQRVAKMPSNHYLSPTLVKATFTGQLDSDSHIIMENIWKMQKNAVLLYGKLQTMAEVLFFPNNLLDCFAFLCIVKYQKHISLF